MISNLTSNMCLYKLKKVKLEELNDFLEEVRKKDGWYGKEIYFYDDVYFTNMFTISKTSILGSVLFYDKDHYHGISEDFELVETKFSDFEKKYSSFKEVKIKEQTIYANANPEYYSSSCYYSWSPQIVQSIHFPFDFKF